MFATRDQGLLNHAGVAPALGRAGQPGARTRTGLRLVVGGDGTIGAELVRQLVPAGLPVAATTRRPGGAALRVDLAEDPAGWELPDQVEVAYLCGAATSGERCRQFPAETRLVNVERTLHLARLLRRRAAHVVFLSSNQVFDGTHPRPPETAPRSPATEYGRQKAQAELGLLAAGGATVVRFTKVVAAAAGLFRCWAERLRRGEPVAPFHDLFLSPVPLGFAGAVLVRVGDVCPGGIVQVSGDRDVSYADVAARLADRLAAPRSLVRPVSFAGCGLPPEMGLPTTALDATRLATELGLSAPPVWDTIDALADGLPQMLVSPRLAG